MDEHENLKDFFKVPVQKPHPYLGKYVIIRSGPSGVHFGILKDYDSSSTQAILANARRIHYWEKAFTLTAIANHGLRESTQTRLSETIKEMSIGYICEILPCTDKAKKSLKNFRVHTI